MKEIIPTPYYLIHEAALLDNLRIIERVRKQSGAKVLLALKCFATWSVFDTMRPFMDGTTSSSLYEVKLGRQKFGGETHAYSVAFADHEIEEVLAHCDKLIFNSISQLERFAPAAGNTPLGLRLNPGVSCAGFDLADPARAFSRLGESDPARIACVLDRITGVLIHNNCENASFETFDRLLGEIEATYGPILQQLYWVSLGGGIRFTAPGYPVEALCARLRAFAERWGVQVYLEPGEAVVRQTTTLEVSVLDTFCVSANSQSKNIAIVDSSTEAHMLDLLIYRETAPIGNDEGAYVYQICGKTCLAGDIFGEGRFDRSLQVGDRLSIGDAGAYTMVKKNWFNGIHMPSIVIRTIDGRVRPVRTFSYEDYIKTLS